MGWLRILAVAGLSLASLARSEPVQYCRRGGPSEIDFCLGALMYSNMSTSSHDLFLTFTVTRHSGSALGWTAVGAGNRMNGALMFIVYGDPLSPTNPPIVSIRTSTSHSRPTLLNRSDLPPGMDLRVISSLWTAPSPTPPNTHTATIHLICYSCALWPTADLSPLSPSQPWIWAWNPSQPFDVYTFDAHLAMHKHHAGAGGWGNFYLDMRRAVSTARYPPSWPPVRPRVDRLGAADTPLSLAGMVTGKGSVVHALGVWLFWAEVRRRRKQVSSAADPASAKLNDTTFVVGDSDEESENEGKAED
ncbi:hypothetical protein F5144DRAFT_595504 [Chaetomium tenue]|uniref:Uncharacterized protein n=1 Tax=Chaetomium tenue TaxID=1854479 RepID=A0ACB7NXZ1_9PEZI|nr:hypothetical protein F5144DRAFT_595504 [Chaetomium globosum]